MIDHRSGREFHICPKLFLKLWSAFDFFHGRLHARQPGIVLRRTNLKSGVPHPQPGVTPGFLISLGSAPILLQKKEQPFCGFMQFSFWVHGAQNRIYSHQGIEMGDQIFEGLMSPDGFIESGFGQRVSFRYVTR